MRIQLQPVRLRAGGLHFWPLTSLTSRDLQAGLCFRGRCLQVTRELSGKGAGAAWREDCGGEDREA